MTSVVRVARLPSCVALLLLAAATGSAASAPSDESAIRDLIHRYAAAIDAADPALAAQIWSHSPEVSFIHPMGEERGLPQIQQNVYTHLMGETFSERHLHPHDISVHIHGNGAWAEFLWDFQAKRRKDGSSLSTHGLETQIYRKEKDGWRIIHVHYSAAPSETRPQ